MTASKTMQNACCTVGDWRSQIFGSETACFDVAAGCFFCLLRLFFWDRAIGESASLPLALPITFDRISVQWRQYKEVRTKVSAVIVVCVSPEVGNQEITLGTRK